MEDNIEIHNCIITEGVTIPNLSRYKDVLIYQDGDKYSTEPISIHFRNFIEKDGDETDESDLIQDDSDEEEKEAVALSFEEEIESIIKRQMEEEHPIDSARVEINSVKFSANKSLSDCISAIVSALINIEMEEQKNLKETIVRLQKIFTDYSGLFQMFIISDVEQAAFINGLEQS